MLLPDVAERRGDAVEEWLRADENVIGKEVRAKSEMLARAEADFEMERPVLTEKARRGDFALRRDFDLGQQPIDEVLLALAQLVPARPAVEAVEGGRIARLVRSHAGAA